MRPKGIQKMSEHAFDSIRVGEDELGFVNGMRPTNSIHNRFCWHSTGTPYLRPNGTVLSQPRAETGRAERVLA